MSSRNKEASCYCAESRLCGVVGERRKFSVAWKMTTRRNSSIVFFGDDKLELVKSPSSSLRSEWGMTKWKEWAYSSEESWLYWLKEKGIKNWKCLLCIQVWERLECFSNPRNKGQQRGKGCVNIYEKGNVWVRLLRRKSEVGSRG